MSDEKLDRIIAKLDEQGRDLTEIRTILLPPGEEPPLAAIEDRVRRLENWRSYLAGAWAVVAGALGIHFGTARGGH